MLRDTLGIDPWYFTRAGCSHPGQRVAIWQSTVWFIISEIAANRLRDI